MTLHATYRPVRPQRPHHALKRATTRPRAGEKSRNQRLSFAAKKPQPRLHCSQQFSVVALTTSSGAIAERYAYSAYGAPTVCNASGTDIGSSAKDNRITFTGREWDDELVLYHFRARLYDAEVGRFCSKDPIRYGDGPNMYAYTANMPLIAMDPTGLQVPIPLPRIVPLPRVYPRIYVPPPTPPKPFVPFPPVPAPVPVPMPGGGPDPRPTPEPIPPNQPYPGDDMEPPGDCSQAQYDLLRNAVLRDCKAGDLQSCRDGVLPWRCSSYKDMAEKYGACADARRRLDQACFRGGDRGHQIQEGQMRNAAQWCWYYYRKCKPCPQLQSPLIAGGPGAPNPMAMSASLE